MAGRKLQKEIEMVFKKVDDGVLVFEQIWDKVYSAATAAQKEKYEGDLKKEIKKLQRLRDQIKSWQGDSSIKDKSKLDSYRKLIESKMEKFKVCEKETKTKAFSKEGLALDRTDPKEKAKQDVSDWVAEAISKLGDQRDELEAEIESLGTTRKGKKGGAAAERVVSLQQVMERHNHHADMLEKVLRAVCNETITPEQVDDIKDGIEYYIESNQDPDFMEDDTMYDELDLDQIPATATIASKADNEDEADVGEPEKTPSGSGSAAAGNNTNGGTSNSKMSTTAKRAATRQEKAEAAREAKSNSATSNNASSKSTGFSSSKSSGPVATGNTSGGGKDIKAANGAMASSEVARSPSSPPQMAFSSVVKGTAGGASVIASSAVAGAPSAVSKILPSLAQHPDTAPNLDSTGLASSKASSTARAAGVQSGHLAQPAQSSSAVDMHQGGTDQGRSAPPSVIGGAIKPGSAARGSALPSTAAGVGAKPAFGNTADSSIPPPSAIGSIPGALSAAHAAPSSASSAPAAPRGDDGGSNLVNDLAFSSSALDKAFEFELPLSMEGELALLRKKERVSGFAGTSGPQRVPTPSCFPQTVAPVFETEAIFNRFVQDTLFFIFYYQPGKYHQYLAAKELKKQSWRFHKKYCTWFQRHDEPRIATEEFEQGTYVYFDYVLKDDLDAGWIQRFKSDFTFEYAFLEDELQ
uniref:CCR4-NOT transcription complex subunit 3 n=1 Tax=Erythrolobus madagascarensis TaxID=708628 RepID=A0A7S0XJW1_9RHOD|mmetsp:Transcript_3779/g.8323  ORF Transcript_3779/g.8323 Transcript_3779/m.8323 type:complete len:694 (+) Transcript_3779:79-2160(+)